MCPVRFPGDCTDYNSLSLLRIQDFLNTLSGYFYLWRILDIFYPLANGSGIGKAELLKFSIHEKQTNVAIIRLGDVPDELTSVGCRREQALV